MKTLRGPRRPLRRFALVLAFAGVAAPMSAAVRIGPPSEILTRGQNEAAVVRAVAPVDSESYRFTLVKPLHGEVDPVLVVRMEPEIAAGITAGERYVLGYTELLPVLGRKNTYAPDPQGPRIIGFDDAGPALVEDVKTVRRLIETARSEDPRDAGRDLELILRQLAKDEPAARRFVAAELHLRTGLAGLLTVDAGEPMDTSWRATAADPQTRYHLLAVAEGQVATLGTERLARYAREVLDSHAARLELTSYDPLLVVTAARALGPVGNVDDLARLEKHLYSNNTGVPKAVLPSMESIDPASTRTAARRVLASTDLNPETRRVLNVYLSRDATPR